MPEPTKQKRIHSQVGTGISVLDRETLVELDTLARELNARADTLVAMVVFLQINSGRTFTRDDILHGFSAPASDAKAAWDALNFGGWIEITDNITFIHRPIETPLGVVPPLVEWENPLQPLADAWKTATGSVVSSFALTRLYNLYSKTKLVTVPYAAEQVCAFYHLALSGQSFEDLVSDLMDGEDAVSQAAGTWESQGRPDLATHIEAAEKMYQAWVQVKAFPPKRHQRLSLIRGSLLGVTPEKFTAALPYSRYLGDCIRGVADTVLAAGIPKEFPLDLEALKPE